jgi:hypothetical protein
MRIHRTAVTVLTVAALMLTGGGVAQAGAALADGSNQVVAPPATAADALAFSEAVGRIEPKVARNADGTLTVEATAAGSGVTEETFGQIVASVEALNQLVRQGVLETSDNLRIREVGRGPVLTHNAINVRWWGIEVHLNSSATSDLLGVMTAGAGIAAVVSVLTIYLGGSGLLSGIAAGLLTLGVGVIQLCSNSNGVIIAKPHVGPPWCRGH